MQSKWIGFSQISQNAQKMDWFLADLAECAENGLDFSQISQNAQKMD
jgi:hypothetical protein